MEGGYNGSDEEKEDVEETTSHLRDRFRLSTISIAESEGKLYIAVIFVLDWNYFRFIFLFVTAKQDNMEISQPVIVCISDLAFKYAGTASAPFSSYSLSRIFVHSGSD